MPSSDSSRASWRRRVLAGAAVGWVLIVVAGAGPSADDSLLGVDNLDVVWAIILGLAGLAGLAFWIYLNPFSTEWAEPDKQRRGVAFWLAVAAVLALLSWRPEILDNILDRGEIEEIARTFEVEPDTTPDEAAPDTVAQASDILILVAVIAALGGAWYLIRRRNQGAIELVGDQSDVALERDLVQALEQASLELGDTRDPRTAVLRSYAVLETVLATHNLLRTKAETPTEHLRRSLRDLRVDAAPLIQLGQLYELARFSDHPISAAQQNHAAQALDRARSSLASLI